MMRARAFVVIGIGLLAVGSPGVGAPTHRAPIAGPAPVAADPAKATAKAGPGTPKATPGTPSAVSPSGTVAGPVAAGLPAPTAAGATVDDVVVLRTDTRSDANSPALRSAIARLGATVRHIFPDQQTVSLQLPAGTDPTAATTNAALAAMPGVARVEPAVTRTFGSVPNDPQLPGQRAYLDAIAAPAAWERQRGSAAVRIAVVDSGVDVTHPDLAGKIAGSYNAVTRTASVPDTVGHGTFVAGVAAAATGNGVGVAGAGYDSSILAVKVADQFGDIAIDDEIAGIRWAVDHGAKIINLSLSGPDPSTAERLAVEYAQAKGAVVVAAAGNDGNTVRQYPAAYPGVVAVGATDVAQRRRATFSSHGSWVTLAAPGVNVLSTSPVAGSSYFPGRSGYARGDGTSFAAPLVAGAAALLAAQNPAMTADQLRAAVVASAHGYAGDDLGRGQVDMSLALDHVTPTSVPGAPATSDTAGTIGFTVASTAPRVSLRIDNGAWLPSVPVTGGTGRQDFVSYGYANGPHTVSAVDCSAYGECSTAATEEAFTVRNTAPILDTPTGGSTVSGEFRAAASAPGGGLRLLIDGREAGFDATAPYAFTVNGSGYDNGSHEVTVQSCSADHAVCDGPSAPAAGVTFDSLHPTITGLTRSYLSPNGDGSGDTAVLSFRLDQPQGVTVETRTAAGDTVRTDAVPTGTSWTWRGLDAAGRALPDGAYLLALVTSQPTSTGTRRGLAERAVVVDTRAPRLSSVLGDGIRFFPVRDNYRDTFEPSASLPDGGLLTLTITTSAGRFVRSVSAARPPSARTSVSWDGRTTAGRLVPAGLYRWTFTVADAAGNITRSASYRVIVDGRRLRQQTVSIEVAARARVVGTARCASSSRSAFRNGVHLVNRCPSDSGDVSYATYSIAVPAAMQYSRLQFDIFGRSARTSQLNASLLRTDGGLEVPGAVRVAPSRSRWYTVSSVPADSHILRRRVTITVLLSSRYPGDNDFDARSVRLRVTLIRLG